jgi:hypothetical protein
LAAVSGTAFAQSSVTLSGKLGFGVQAAKGKAAGVAVTDGDIVFTAVEDLGGGLKATVSTAMLLRGRDTSGAQVIAPAAGSAGVANGNSTMISSVDRLTARDATITLSGAFGSATIGAIEAGNGILGLGMGGAPVSLAEGLDSSKGVVAAASNTNILQWTSNEVVPGLKLSVTRTDGINNFYADKNTSGTVTAGTAINLNNDYRGSVQSNGLGLTYAAGALAIAADVTDYSGTTANRNRFSASYDLGMVKLGAGIQTQQGADDQRVFGLSAPVGALTLGVARADAGTKKGTVYGAQYAFSKTTNFNVSVGDFSGTSFDGSQWRARLLKSF